MRSALAGGAATIADLATVALLVGGLGVSARAANIPALLVGAAVQFFGNRHFAFRASGGSVKKQLTWFGLAEIVAIALNAVLFDAVARALPLGALGAMATRALTTNVVFLAFSYPVWKRIFRAEQGDSHAPPSLAP